MPDMHRYDVALSFAGEDRQHALGLAARLQRAGLRVFVDRFEELWGQDLSVRLHEIYDHQCRHAVVFVSRAYLARPWTNFERQVLVSRLLREDPGFLLPVHVDGTSLPGLPGVLAYKDLREHGIDEIADALCRLAGAKRPPAPLALTPSDFLYVVVDPQRPDAPAFNLGCLVSNGDDTARALRHLEARVTPAGEAPLQYQKRGFFSLDMGHSQPAMRGVDEAWPLPLAAGESRLLGVCFIAAPLAAALAWPAGPLDVELLGWADSAPRRETPDFGCRFTAELTPDVWTLLEPWLAPPPGIVLQVPIAVPLPVTPATRS